MAEIYYDSTYGLLQEVANTGNSKNRNENKYGVFITKFGRVVEDLHFAPLTSCCQIWGKKLNSVYGMFEVPSSVSNANDKQNILKDGMSVVHK